MSPSSRSLPRPFSYHWGGGQIVEEAAYTGQQITWEQALNSQEAIVPDKLTWDMSLPVSPRPAPGVTKFL